MAELPIGTVLMTDGSRKVKVIKELGRGGQGIVYQVDMDGKFKALKWYHEGAIKERKPFYENLRNNIQLGSPAGCFLWPEDSVRSEQHNSFGYVMDLRPGCVMTSTLLVLAIITERLTIKSQAPK